MSECDVPADSYIFVKVLNLLILSQQVHMKDDGSNLAVVKNIYETLLELKA